MVRSLALAVAIALGTVSIPAHALGLGDIQSRSILNQEFDADIVAELRNRANDALLTKAIAKEEVLGDAKPAEDLLGMDGMDDKLAHQLAARGVVTMEDLAECAVDELMEVNGMDETRAGELIMAARAPWFAEDAE